MLDMLTVIHGKIKTLDMLYGARESIETSSTTTYSRIPHFIEEGTFDKKYKKFSDCLVKHLTSKQKISKKEAEKVVKDGMDFYLENRLRFGEKEETRSLKRGIRKLILKHRYLRINLTQYGKFSFD